MTALRRTLVALLVVVLLVGTAVGIAEWLVRRQVEALVTDVVEAELARSTGGSFGSLRTSVGGWALLGLARGELERVEVDGTDGLVQDVPVGAAQLVADGVSTDGRSVQALRGSVRADAADVVAGLLGQQAGTGPVVAVALPPDRVRVSADVEQPGLGVVPVEVELLVRAADGGLVVEPVAATAAGVPLDDAQVDVFRSAAVAAEDLPAGLEVSSVTVSDVDGRAVLDVQLLCPSGCSLR